MPLAASFPSVAVCMRVCVRVCARYLDHQIHTHAHVLTVQRDLVLIEAQLIP